VFKEKEKEKDEHNKKHFTPSQNYMYFENMLSMNLLLLYLTFVDKNHDMSYCELRFYSNIDAESWGKLISKSEIFLRNEDFD
jgi:hypothetical protein